MNKQQKQTWGALLALTMMLAACSSNQTSPHPPVISGDGNVSQEQAQAPRLVDGYYFKQQGSAAAYKVVPFSALPQWDTQNFVASLNAFRKSCGPLQNNVQWRNVCLQAATIGQDNGAARAFFERYFTAWEVSHNGQLGGTITGYYEPVLQGNQNPTVRSRFPIYGIPNDLVTVPLNGRRSGSVRIRMNNANSGQISDLGMVVANLSEFPIRDKTTAIKGRLVGNRLLPYYTRAQINAGALNGGKAPILGYADDPVDLFFLHVQGSGRIQTPDGRFIRLGFADKNEYPYVSIGRYMANRGYLPLAQTSAQGIKAWLRAHPEHLAEVLGQNPSYVFFRELPSGDDGPLGALGVPLTGGYSGAVDKRYITLGAPIFVATAHPDTGRALNRLMMAQDTGSAINGAVRVDYFWGYGDEAGRVAGRMKQTGYVWELLPNGVLPSAN